MENDRFSFEVCFPTVQSDQLKIRSYRREELPISTRQTPWHPPTDVYETDLTLVISVEVAGISEKNFLISIENQKVCIQGNRPGLNEKKIARQSEIQYGEFETIIELPIFVDTANGMVSYENGFLRITFHKIQNIPV